MQGDNSGVAFSDEHIDTTDEEAQNLLVGQEEQDETTVNVPKERKYSERKIYSLSERFRLRRRSDWLPLYGLEAKAQVGTNASSTRKRRTGLCSAALNCCYILMAITGLCTVFGILFGYVGIRHDDVFWPEWGTPGHEGEYLAHYPTDFTRDVLPVPCHSHNDYWRRIPLFDAVHAGCTSVEADVWRYHGDLLVGHSELSISPNRTFNSLYINPLIQILEKQNQQSASSSNPKNGVFDEDPSRSLILLVDFKMQPEETFYDVQKQIAPLRDRGYLTYYDGKSIIQRPITVVGTGETPFDLVVANQTYRDIFFDAPLQAFSIKNPSPDSLLYNQTNSYYASSSAFEAVGFPWLGRYTESQVEKLRDHIKGAQKAGLKSRYWDTPAWPVGLRHYIWTLLVKEGTDMLNVDDLKGATTGKWGNWG